MTTKRTVQTLLLAAVACGAVAFGYVAGTTMGDPATPAFYTLAPQAATGHPARPAATSSAEPAFYQLERQPEVPTVTLPDFADIYERVSPAVVSISATKFNDEQSRPGGRLFQDPFQWFFGQPDGPQGQRPGQPRREESGGTGFIITPDGYVLTNYHVVEKADIVRVRVNREPRDKEFEGKVIGTDPATDIALVKIEPDQELPYLPLGDSGALRVGEWVMAIGNPFFYEDSVTAGVVSAKGRRLDGLSRDPSLDNYIQTDAAINVGNSGGPLLNLRGEVVGINTAVSRMGQGIGFAIPINMAKTVVPQLRESGRVARGAIGVTIQDISLLDPDEREYWGLKGVTGALVQDVTPDQPAARAGVKPGDAIIAINGDTLGSSNELISRISSHRPGEVIQLTLLRQGRKMNADVRLQDREEILYQETSASRPEGSEPQQSPIVHQIGVRVEDLTAETRRTFNVPRDVNGVVVADVSVRGEAYEKGLRPGMVILEVNRKPVTSVREYMNAVEGVGPGGLLNFYVQAGESRNFVTFRLGDAAD